MRPCTLGGLDKEAAVELLARAAGPVRITVDPRSAEALVEVCEAHPAALVLAGGWLSVRPKAAVADLAKRLHDLPGEGPALARVFRHTYATLSGPPARILRLLSLAPAGHVDPHTASALAGFVGPRRELKELRADIDRAGLDTLSGRKAPRARVLLVAGRPGSGRTSLAEALARGLAHEYPDGVLRASLTEPDGTRVPTERTARTLLDALSVPAPAGAHEDELTEIL
ncbi:hypothetical protein SALBM135S_06179 [Streptomyces alboniger]